MRKEPHPPQHCILLVHGEPGVFSKGAPSIWNSPWALPRRPQGAGLLPTSRQDCPHIFGLLLPVQCQGPTAATPQSPLKHQQLQEVVRIFPLADLGWNCTFSLLTRGCFPGKHPEQGWLSGAPPSVPVNISQMLRQHWTNLALHRGCGIPARRQGFPGGNGEPGTVLARGGSTWCLCCENHSSCDLWSAGEGQAGANSS